MVSFLRALKSMHIEPANEIPKSGPSRRAFLGQAGLVSLSFLAASLAGCGSGGSDNSNASGSGNKTGSTTQPTPTPSDVSAATSADTDIEPSGKNDGDPIPSSYGPLLDDPKDLITTSSSDPTGDGRASFVKSDYAYELDKDGKPWRVIGWASVVTRQLADGRTVLFSQAPVESTDGATSLRIGYRFVGGGWRKAVLSGADMTALRPTTKSVLTPMQGKSVQGSRGLFKWAKQVWKRISRAVGKVLVSVGETVGKAVEKLVVGLIDNVANVAKNWISKWLDTAGSDIVGTLLATVSTTAYTSQTPLTIASLYKPAFDDASSGAGAAQAMVLAIREYAA